MNTTRFLKILGIAVLCLIVGYVLVNFIYVGNLFPQEYKQEQANNVAINNGSQKDLTKNTTTDSVTIPVSTPPVSIPLDKVSYDLKMNQISNGDKGGLWPVDTVYPNGGALLPFNRIVAYYGNFYSTQMGVLGAYPPDEMLSRLSAEVKKWQLADPSTPVIPAIDYIAVTAQGSPGDDGKYRLRMPSSQLDIAINLAAQVHGIVFLDVQVGLSTVQQEIPLLETYLKMPQVHLALDPEFSMKTGARPGTVIGTMDATDINFAANYLAKLVKENNLPPKILVVHRFTQPMVTHYKKIKPLPEVQIVMDMDGWSTPPRKLSTYQSYIYGEPVQFTGFKLFYKNDIRTPHSHVMTPEEVLKLKPMPVYIQYQ